MSKQARHSTTERLDWGLGLLALCLTVLIGGAGTLWSLQQWHANTERGTRQDVQAMAQSVAQTLAFQIGRAVRLGIPLEDIPGMPAYLQRSVALAPGLVSIAVHAPDGRVLHATPAGSAPHHESTAIQVQGQAIGSVVVGTAPASRAQGLGSAYALCALLVLALALLSGWLAARGPGRRLERQRQQLLAGLRGSRLPTDAALPDASHGGLARALHALADGQQQVHAHEAEVHAYAQELLAVDFDQRLQAPIAAIVASAALATPTKADT